MSASKIAPGRSEVTTNVGWQREAGKVGKIFADVVQLLGQRRRVRPQHDLVAAAPRQRERQRRAPGARSENRDPAHAATLREPKRFSVPASRRRMFWWCLTMISSGMKINPAIDDRRS